jgi:trehalose 6-phosphate synthase
MVGINGIVDDPTTNALLTAVRDRQGVWVGRDADAISPVPYRHALVQVGPDEVADFDQGQGGATIWPLYHGLAGPGRFDGGWRRAYRNVNAAYATAAANHAAPGGTVWVHGYKLQLVPTMLRRQRPDLRIGFHLPIPFPAPDLFRRLPMHYELLTGLLGADLIGFQSAGAAENFLQLTRYEPGFSTSVGVFPTAPDTAAITALAVRADIARRVNNLRTRLGNPRVMVLSINTHEATQGIERRLAAVGEMFAAGHLDPAEVAVVQLVTGQVTDMDMSSCDGIAREAARINGQFAAVGRPCVHYVRCNPDLAERVTLYRAADVMLATPLSEGVTMPALEFAAAARPDAALVLSEFSGTAGLLPDAYLVNPYDDDQVCAGIVAALEATRQVRTNRMHHMRQYLARYDNDTWATSFLHILASTPTRPAESIRNETVWPRQRYRRSSHDNRWWLNVHAGGQG